MLRNFCVHTMVDVTGYRRKMVAGSSSLKHFAQRWGEQGGGADPEGVLHGSQSSEVILSLDPHRDPENKLIPVLHMGN